MKLPMLPTVLLPLPSPQDQMILMSMLLVYLRSLPLVFVYFLHITLFLKNKPMIAWWLIRNKKRINHQNEILCFRSYIINEWPWWLEKQAHWWYRAWDRAHRRHWRSYWRLSAHNHRSRNGCRNIFGLRTLGVGQYGALLASTSSVWFDVLYDD